MNIAYGGEEKRDSYYETLNLFQNVCWLRVYHKFHEYIVDKIRAKLVEGTTLSLAKLDACTVAVVHCFAEQEIRGKYRRELYDDTFGAYLKLALAQNVS